MKKEIETAIDIEDYDTVEVEKENVSEDDYPNLNIKIEPAQFSVFELKKKIRQGKNMY